MVDKINKYFDTCSKTSLIDPTIILVDPSINASQTTISTEPFLYSKWNGVNNKR